MSLRRESAEIEKNHKDGPPVYNEPHSFTEHTKGRQLSTSDDDHEMITADQNALKRNLKGRHMQMIAM